MECICLINLVNILTKCSQKCFPYDTVTWHAYFLSCLNCLLIYLLINYHLIDLNGTFDALKNWLQMTRRRTPEQMKELENTQGFFRMTAYLIGVHRETWLQKCRCKLGLYEQKHRIQNKGNIHLLYFPVYGMYLEHHV